MSIRCMVNVWDYSRTKGTERLVMLALADSANDAGICWPSVATIAKKAATGERNARKILAKLEQTPELKIEHVAGTSNRYHVLISAESYPQCGTTDQGWGEPQIRGEGGTTDQGGDELQIRGGMNHRSGEGGTVGQPNPKEPKENPKENQLASWLAENYPQLKTAFDDIGITAPTRYKLAQLGHVQTGGAEYVRAMVASAENIRLAIYRMQVGDMPPAQEPPPDPLSVPADFPIRRQSTRKRGVVVQ